MPLPSNYCIDARFSVCALIDKNAEDAERTEQPTSDVNVDEWESRRSESRRSSAPPAAPWVRAGSPGGCQSRLPLRSRCPQRPQVNRAETR